MSIGIVLKGVTPLIGGLTLLTLLLVERKLLLLRRLHVVCGILFVLAVTYLWLHQVDIAAHQNYLWAMIKRDLLPKLTHGDQSHGMWPGYHLLLLPLTFWPSSLFLATTTLWTWQHRHQRHVIFLLAWLLPSFIFLKSCQINYRNIFYLCCLRLPYSQHLRIRMAKLLGSKKHGLLVYQLDGAYWELASR